MTEPSLLSAVAPAKVNLYLHVTGRLKNGYHTVDSLAGFTTIGDRLHWTPNPKPLSFKIRGPFAEGLPADDGNLVVRAAEGVGELTGVPIGGEVVLIKNLPVASGIGGGSSDAAAMLRLAASRANLPLDDPDLLALATRLGADVPVCIERRTRHMAGIGEILNDGPSLAGLPIVLANPGIEVPTPAVFKARTGGFTAPNPPSGEFDDLDTLIAALAERRNDLEAPATALFPPVLDCLQALGRTKDCRLARMSGSGATCFGLFGTSAAAEAAAAALRADTDWWVEAGRLL